MNNVPTPPTSEQLEYMSRMWEIDAVSGRVYSKSKFVKKELGSKREGYVRVQANVGGIKRSFNRSHLVWWKHTGEWPSLEIDHKNLKKDDDRFENLQLITGNENRYKKTNNSSLGVGIRTKGKKFQAYIGVNKKQRCLGVFDTIEEATAARGHFIKESGIRP